MENKYSPLIKQQITQAFPSRSLELARNFVTSRSGMKFRTKSTWSSERILRSKRFRGVSEQKSPKHGIFEVLAAQKMGREQFAARKMGREQKNERHHPTETLATQAQVSGKRMPGY